MKKVSFLTILIALMAMFFAACGDDSSSATSSDPDSNSSSDNPSGDKGNGSEADIIDAFFPSDFAKKEVEAWYMYQEVQKDNTQRVMAIFCFSDGTGVVTTHKLKSDGGEFKFIESEIEYTIESGDYSAGKISISAMGQKMSATIADGVMTSKFFEGSFSKQDNKKVPAASKTMDNPGNGGSSGNGGSENQSGDNGQSTEIGEVEAFFPSSCDKKTVSAWYLAVVEDSESQVKIEAVFLFDDNTLVVTKHKKKSDGREFQEVMYSGEWVQTDGDFVNGTAKVDGEIEVTIADGVLNAMGTNYEKQDNGDVPAASDEIKEE